MRCASSVDNAQRKKAQPIKVAPGEPKDRRDLLERNVVARVRLGVAAAARTTAAAGAARVRTAAALSTILA